MNTTREQWWTPRFSSSHRVDVRNIHLGALWACCSILLEKPPVPNISTKYDDRSGREGHLHSETRDTLVIMVTNPTCGQLNRENGIFDFSCPRWHLKTCSVSPTILRVRAQLLPPAFRYGSVRTAIYHRTSPVIAYRRCSPPRALRPQECYQFKWDQLLCAFFLTSTHYWYSDM